MKTNTKLLAFFLFTFFYSLNSNAQVVSGMTYQAVIRNSSNALIVNTVVGVKISILEGSATGTVVFSERHTPTTNANGLATFVIGEGTPIISDFFAINWLGGLHFIKTETDPTGGTNYTITNTSQLNTVPYSQFAENSLYASYSGDSWKKTGNIVDASTQFIGSTNDVDVIFKRAGTETMRFNQVGAMRFPGSEGNRKIALWDINNNDHQFIGFGLNNSVLRYQTNGPGTDHIFYSGINATSSTELMRVKGNGNVGIGVNPTEKLEVVGKTKTTNLQVTNGAGINKVLTSDSTGNATWQNITTMNSGFDIVNAAQVIPNNVYTKIDFVAEQTDDANVFNLSSDELTILSTGFYHFDIYALFNTIAANTLAYIRIEKNGSNFRNVSKIISSNEPISVSLNFSLTAGDIITIKILQTSGASANLGLSSTNLSGFKVY